MTNKKSSISRQTESQSDQDCDVDASSETLVCLRCTSTSRRKRYIQCNVCRQHWHLSCARLTRSQADTLGCWWCPSCTRNTPALPVPLRPSQSSRCRQLRPSQSSRCRQLRPSQSSRCRQLSHSRLSCRLLWTSKVIWLFTSPD